MDHSEHIKRGVNEVRRFREEMFATLQTSLQADGGAIFPLDILTQLVAKRAVSTASAFASLIEQRNMIGARVLLRTQIDSVIRLNAFQLVDDLHGTATKVLQGEHLRRLKDRTGQKMTDAHLVAMLGKHIEWLPRVYERLSGIVHLSDEFLGLTATAFDEPHRTVTISISEIDQLPDASWEEVMQCFLAASHLILHFIDSWADRKSVVAAERSAAAS